MQDLLDDHELTIAEFCFSQPVTYTYARAGGQSHIDHIAVPHCLASQVCGCNILPPSVDNLSPHLPVICSVVLSSGLPTASLSTRSPGIVQTYSDVLDWRCPDKLEAYISSLEELLGTCIPSHDASPDELDAIITRCIHTAARNAGCSKPRRPPKPWWSPVVSAARDRARFWHQIWVGCGRPTLSAVSQCYQAARSAYRHARRRAAVSRIESEAHALRLFRRDKNLTAFWRRVQCIRRGGLKSVSDRCTSDFRNHFQTVHQDSCGQLTPGQLQVAAFVETRLRETRGAACNRTVTAEQVAGFICRLRRGKSSGVDGITAEHLIYGQSPALLAALAHLLSACLSTCSVPATFADSVVVPLLKKAQLDPNCLDNYRPIAITTCASKLLEFLVLDELDASFSPHDLQFGFISHRGTAQASLLAGETIQQNRRRGLPVFAANLDARKCFDRIWHDGLFFRLADHLSINCWRIMVTWYRRLSARVTFGGATSEPFQICRGTRQGAILSPTLANIFLFPLIEALDRSNRGALLHGHHVPAICYADDLLLLSTNARDLGALLQLVGDFAASWRLDFVHPDPAKTKSHCITFGRGLLASTPMWALSGQQLQVRQTTEHLGMVMDECLRADPHVAQRARRACAAFYGLTPLGIFTNRLTGPDKIFLWKTVVLPALLFGCETAPLCPSDIDRLNARQAALIKSALGLPRSAHHTALLLAAGVPRVDETLRGAVLRAFSGIFRSAHRLRHAYITALARLAVCPDELAGSFLSQVASLCYGDFSAVMSTAAGRVDQDLVRAPVEENGLVDSIRLVLAGNCQASRRLLRLLTS